MTISDLRQNPTDEWIEEIRARYPVERTVDEALTRKLLRRREGETASTDLGDLRERLMRFLENQIDGTFEMRDLRPLTGGASKEQYVFDIDWTLNGELRRGDRMVLRREPAESVVETDRLREFQLLRAVGDIVPVPDARWLDPTGEALGRPTMVCGFVTGVQKPPSGSSNVTGVGIEFDAEHRDALGPEMIKYLARIHNFDGSSGDLSAFDLPTVGTTQDIDWQLNWWSRVWEEDSYENIPLFRSAERWLRRNRQPLDVLSLIHSDYRTGNYLFDPATKKITTVLDWELGYFGDRHFDLAWLLLPAFVTKDENGAARYASIFHREEFIEAYQAESGLKVDRDRLQYYMVFALWKGVTMTLGSALRAAGGLRTHQDVLMSWFSGLGYPLLECLRRELRQVTEVDAPILVS